MKLPAQPTTSFFSVIILALFLFSAGCENEQKTEGFSSVPKHENTFTFFGIGKNSIISKPLKKDLKEQLGSYAIERRNIVDLEINYKGFLKEFFPEIDQLNQGLNFPPKERVEHNTVKLMFRYAQKKNLAFDYVEFVFSEYTQTPVLIRIHFRKDDAQIIKTLKDKYGLPETIHLSRENSTSLFWKKGSDVMLMSFVPDQFGDPRSQIVIYFTDELKRLHTTELAEKEKKQLERSQSSKTAF